MSNSPDPSILNSLSHTQQEVLRGLVRGLSISAAARAAQVHRATVYLWIRTVPTFSRALDAHRRLRADRIADDLHALADSAVLALRQILDDPESPAAVRYKVAIDIVGMTQHQTETALYRESQLLWDFHADLDATPESASPAPFENPAPETTSPQTEAMPPAHSSPVRNAPCPCGSHLKYKRCCGKRSFQALAA